MMEIPMPENEPQKPQPDDDKKAAPDAQGRMESEGHEEEIPKDLPKVPTRKIVIILGVLLFLLIALFLAG